MTFQKSRARVSDVPRVQCQILLTHNIAGVRHTLLGLAALGGDHLLAVLDGGHVHVGCAHCPRHASTREDKI